MSVLYWYLIGSAIYSFLWLMFFVLSDLHSLYKNKKQKTDYRYYVLHDRWEVFLFTSLALIPIVNILFTIIVLGMTVKPLNFIIKWLKG